MVVAIGSMPIIPDVERLKDSRYWTLREAVSGKEVPEHLIVFGAGVVRAEVATLHN